MVVVFATGPEMNASLRLTFNGTATNASGPVQAQHGLVVTRQVDPPEPTRRPAQWLLLNERTVVTVASRLEVSTNAERKGGPPTGAVTWLEGPNLGYGIGLTRDLNPGQLEATIGFRTPHADEFTVTYDVHWMEDGDTVRLAARPAASNMLLLPWLNPFGVFSYRGGAIVPFDVVIHTNEMQPDDQKDLKLRLVGVEGPDIDAPWAPDPDLRRPWVLSGSVWNGLESEQWSRWLSFIASEPREVFEFARESDPDYASFAETHPDAQLCRFKVVRASNQTTYVVPSDSGLRDRQVVRVSWSLCSRDATTTVHVEVTWTGPSQPDPNQAVARSMRLVTQENDETIRWFEAPSTGSAVADFNQLAPMLDWIQEDGSAAREMEIRPGPGAERAGLRLSLSVAPKWVLERDEVTIYDPYSIGYHLEDGRPDGLTTSSDSLVRLLGFDPTEFP